MYLSWWQFCLQLNDFMWTKEPLKVVGIHISYDKAGNESKNVNQKIDNLNAKLGTWGSRQLSIFGRCLIVKSLGISQIVHSAAVLDIHKDYIVKIQSLTFKFMWKEKQDKIKREVLYQDYERGGLRVTHSTFGMDSKVSKKWQPGDRKLESYLMFLLQEIWGLILLASL